MSSSEETGGLGHLGAEAYATVYGQTPLEPDAYEFLTERCKNLRTLQQLNEAEAQNIEKALAWLARQAFDAEEFLSQATLRLLHKKMLSDVWTWAGTYRRHDTNIGLDPSEIAEQVEMLLGNALWQLRNESSDPLEIGVKIHRSLTAIHPFTNGNGRLARLYTEKYAAVAGLDPETFTWGFLTYKDPVLARKDYLDALRHADQTGDHGPLIRIATA